MSSGGGPWWGGVWKPRESTAVTDETERKIPLRVWRDSSLVGCAIVIFSYLILSFAWLQVAKCQEIPFKTWWADYWAFTSKWYPVLLILCCVSWIVLSGLLVWRFWIENKYKHAPPVYTPWPSELGGWTPRRARLLAGQQKGGVAGAYDRIYGSGREQEIRDG